MSSLMITETEMISDTTRHRARAWPVPDEPTLWSVTWLPGRALTRDQAITALTIAEVVAVIDLTDNQHKMWLFIDGWSAELGLSGPDAVAMASLSPDDVPGKSCTKCRKTKAQKDFGPDRSKKDGLRSNCRDCGQESAQRRRAANPEAGRESTRRWREAHPDAELEANRRYYAANAEARRADSRQRHAANRGAVLDHYGQACACCGSVKKLTVDHVNGDGGQHRAEIGGSSRLYRWLIANGFPDGFQTLCRPCNRSKGSGDRCRIDHTAEELSLTAAEVAVMAAVPPQAVSG